MEWIDAFANAAMILSGMGPLAPLQTPAGKLFAGFYALYSELVLIPATGLLLAQSVIAFCIVFTRRQKRVGKLVQFTNYNRRSGISSEYANVRKNVMTPRSPDSLESQPVP